MTKIKDEDDFQTDHLEKLAEEDVDLTEPEASDDIESLKEEKNSLQDRLLR